MSNYVLSVPLPEHVKKELKKHKEIKWTEVARSAVIEKLDLLKRMDELLAKSEFTEEDAIRHGRKINKAMFEKYYSKYKGN